METGSHGLQIALGVAAGVILLLQMIRGWRQGPIRVLFGLLALLGAYLAAWYAGGLLVPVLKPLLGLPAFATRAASAVLTGGLVFLLLSFLGRVLFRKTSEQESGLMRFLYGTGGALAGLALGLVFIWILALGARVLGTVAEAQLKQSDERAERLKGFPPQLAAEANPSPKPLARAVARIKESIELGVAGKVVEAVDVIPDEIYATLDQVSRLAAEPTAMVRLLDYPGAKEITGHPKFKQLQEDPEITRLIEERRFVDLLRHPKLVAAADDPELGGLLRKFDVRQGLDYALHGPPAPVDGAGSPAPTRP